MKTKTAPGRRTRRSDKKNADNAQSQFVCRRSLPNQQQPQRSTTISIASVTSRAYEPSCCRSQKAQKVLFAVLSCCSCVFETRSLLCCLGGAARIRLDGAILDERDRERQDNAYLSIACRASEVTAFSCAARTQQQLPTSTSGGAHPRAGFARYFVWATMMLAVVLLHL